MRLLGAGVKMARGEKDWYKVLETVQKCIRLAQGTNNPHEKALAWSKAREIATKNGILNYFTEREMHMATGDRDRDDRRGRDDDRGRGRDDDRDRGRDGDRGGSRPGFKYRERSTEAVNKRATQQGGMYDSIILPKFPTFTPAEGVNELRILPPTWDDVEKYGDHYGTDIYIHRNVGPDGQTYLCRAKMLGEECAICDARHDLEAAGAPLEESNELKVGKQVALYVIDRKDESAGPLVWTMSWTLDKDIAILSVDRKTGKAVLVDDPNDGFDIEFMREGKGLKTKYNGMQIARRPSPISENSKLQDRWLQFIQDNPIPSTFQFYENEYMKTVYSGKKEEKDPMEERDRRPGRHDDDRGRDRDRGRDDDRGGRDRDDRRGRDEDRRGSDRDERPSRDRDDDRGRGRDREEPRGRDDDRGRDRDDTRRDPDKKDDARGRGKDRDEGRDNSKGDERGERAPRERMQGRDRDRGKERDEPSGKKGADLDDDIPSEGRKDKGGSGDDEDGPKGDAGNARDRLRERLAKSRK